MPSLSDFGLGSDAPDSERRARRRYDDESGARPLPTEAYEPYDDIDERVELPMRRVDAALYFGIGAGLGVAALAIGAALYFGGYIARPALGPSPEATALEPEKRLAPLEEAKDAEALEGARVAVAKLSAPPTFALPPAVESPDITVTEERPAKLEPAPVPRTQSRPKNLGDELESLDRAQPTPMPTPTEPELPPPAQPTAPAEEPLPESPY